MEDAAPDTFDATPALPLLAEQVEEVVQELTLIGLGQMTDAQIASFTRHYALHLIATLRDYQNLRDEMKVE